MMSSCQCQTVGLPPTPSDEPPWAVSGPESGGGILTSGSPPRSALVSVAVSKPRSASEDASCTPVPPLPPPASVVGGCAPDPPDPPVPVGPFPPAPPDPPLPASKGGGGGGGYPVPFREGSTSASP